MGHYGNKRFHTWHERRCEAKTPGLEKSAPTPQKNPVWVFPSRVIKKKATVCLVRFLLKIILLRAIFVFAAEPFVGSIRYPRSFILGLYDCGVAALCQCDLIPD
jgi:hypothetical protein